MALTEAPELIDNVVAAAACVPSWRAGYETIMRLFESDLGKKVPFDRSVGRLFAWVTSEITDAISENGDLPADRELADRTLNVARVFRRVAPTTEKMPPEFLESDLMMIRSAEAWVQFRRAREYAAHRRFNESRALLDAAIGGADEEWRRIKAPGSVGAARGFEVWLVLALARAEKALGTSPAEPNRNAVDAAISTLSELLEEGRRRPLMEEVQRLFPERKISIEANLRECEETRDRLIRCSKN